MANAQVQIRFVNNQKGGESLLISGFRFNMKSCKPDRIYWSCCQQGCGTRATTVDGRLTKHTDNHTHPPNNVDNDIRNIMGDIRKRCRDELTPIPTIYEEEIANIRGKDWDEETEQMARHIPTFQTYKTALYKERSKLRPVLPTSTANIQLEGEWTQTTAGGEFLQINIDETNKMLVVATRTGLQHLCAANTIYADGTFYTCPSLCHQLFTLHGFIDGEMYPLVFAFLPGKSTDVYVNFFSQLKQKCEEYGFELQPETVFLDHEAGGVRQVKKRKYRQLEQRLAALKTRLENGHMTAMEYSDAASQLLHL
ncbi:hypothetical protein MAR_005754, partial [Mya arenaria]